MWPRSERCGTMGPRPAVGCAGASRKSCVRAGTGVSVGACRLPTQGTGDDAGKRHASWKIVGEGLGVAGWTESCGRIWKGWNSG